MNVELLKKHKNRLNDAMQKQVSFMLFDIDHNITDKKGYVPEFMIKSLADLVNNRMIGIGFVSGRPEHADFRGGQDIRRITNRLIPYIHRNKQKNIIIFPEYGGYGVNIGTGEEYSYGFISIFEEYKPQLSVMLDKAKYKWCDYIEHKKTGISLWVNESFRSPVLLQQFQKEIFEMIFQLGAAQHLIVINGAGKTIDILLKDVNKQVSIKEVSKIYNIPEAEIATSDDQAGQEEAGFLFTNHPLGFATKSFSKESSSQISTLLALNSTGIEAIMLIIELLRFKPLS